MRLSRRRDGGHALERLLDLVEGVLLLLEVLLQQAHHVVATHRPGVDDQALVHGDLVVLGLGGARFDPDP